VQGQICDILRPQLAMNRFLPLLLATQIPTLWIHTSGGGRWGGGGGGGSDIRSMCSIPPICKCRCPPLAHDRLSPMAARYKDEGRDDESSNDEDSLTMDEDVRRERMRVLNGGSAGDVLQV
jgi:hypothetical protein